MQRKKIILIGCPAVGKTSLVTRLTKGVFSDRYLSTVGVKIDKKIVQVDGQAVMLLIWDLAGDVEIKGPAKAFIRGADGCLLVADGTRKDTLDLSLKLFEQIIQLLGIIPVVLAINKADLSERWVVTETEVASIVQRGIPVFKTSAKGGNGVEDAFLELSRKAMVGAITGAA